MDSEKNLDSKIVDLEKNRVGRKMLRLWSLGNSC